MERCKEIICPDEINYRCVLLENHINNHVHWLEMEDDAVLQWPSRYTIAFSSGSLAGSE